MLKCFFIFIFGHFHFCHFCHFCHFVIFVFSNLRVGVCVWLAWWLGWVLLHNEICGNNTAVRITYLCNAIDTETVYS